MRATGIPSAHVPLVWDAVWPLLEPAYAQSPEKDDVFTGLVNRDFVLWVIYDRTNPVAGIVSKLLRNGDPTSGELHAHLWLIGGSHLSIWLHDFLRIFVPWAKAEGATYVTGNGRKGWAKVARELGCERWPDRGGMPVWALKI